MASVSEKNITLITSLHAVLMVCLLVFSTGALLLFARSYHFDNELEELEQTFIAEQKIRLKADVEELTSRIDSRRQWGDRRQEQQLEAESGKAWRIASGLYDRFGRQVAENELKNIIKEAVRPLCLQAQEGYCFILSEAGQALLFPADQALEGKNLYTEAGGGDPEVIDNLITIARESGRGSFRYEWPGPGGGAEEKHQKIAYVTWFEPYQWVIGSGNDLDNLDAAAQDSAVDELRNSLSGDMEDYYFIYKINYIKGGEDFATILINSNRPDLVNKTISDTYTDAKGKPFRQEFLKGIRDSGEAYVTYWYKKPDGTEIGRKLSYFKLYPEWNWVIARGVYFDRLDREIAAHRESYQRHLKRDIKILVLLFITALSLTLWAAYRFAGQIRSSLLWYRSEQQDHLREMEQLNKELGRQNLTDPLTRIYSRAAFTTRLEEEKKRATRYRSHLSILLLDIDQFKDINDGYGHLTGDDILREMSQLVAENIRATDTFARWGGEEFIILAPGIDIDQARLMAEQLRKLIGEYTFPADLKVTCSFGVSTYHVGEESRATLLRAETALAKAKQHGRNRTVAL